MRSSLPSFSHRPRRSAVVVLGCTCLLLPFVVGLDRQDIDLKAANHDREAVDKDSKYAEVATSRRQHESAWLRKDRPNKSSTKKYVEESWADFQYGKSKKSIYDKKYFDYLPAELKDSPGTPSDVSLSKRPNSRRIRRNADGGEPKRVRRQGVWYMQPLASYTYTIPQRIQPAGFAFQSSWMQHPIDPNYRPTLFNQYLPPAPVRPDPPRPTTGRPIQETWGSTDNQGRRPEANRSYLPPDDDLGNRGSFDDRQFIFDTVYDPSKAIYTLMTKRPQAASSGQNPNALNNNGGGRVTTTTTTTGRPVGSGTTRGTTTPPPSIQHNSDDDYDWSNLGPLTDVVIGTRLGVGEDGQASPAVANRPAINPPVVSNTIDQNNANRRAPTKCTWAIANCCSHNSDRIRYYCFEQNQCYGAFWGENVCRAYLQVALREIEEYYDV